MLNKSSKFLEQELDRVRERLDDLVQAEVVDLVLSWNKRFPKFRFKIENYDLCSFYYKEVGDTSWDEMNVYKPSAYVDDIKIVIREANEFTKALFGMDQRFTPSNFGEIM